MEEPVRLEVTIGGEDFILTEDNCTVFRFREAKHMDHVFIVKDEGKSTMLFGEEWFIKKLIDMDFPLQTSRWPRPFDFEAYDKYIDQLAEGLMGEIEGL